MSDGAYSICEGLHGQTGDIIHVQASQSTSLPRQLLNQTEPGYSTDI